MLFKPNPSSGVPIYHQLMEQVKHSVETGALRPGEQLPGSRPLAIDDGPKNSGNWQGPGATGGMLTGGASPNVQLRRPEAVGDPIQRPMAVPLRRMLKILR